jgi:hypothetical protein
MIEAARTTVARWWEPALAVGVLAAVSIYTFVSNPYAGGVFPSCVFLAGSGHYCPGCGGLRAAHSLMHGDFAAAMDMNPVVVLIIIPLGIVALGWWILRTAGVAPPPPRLSTGAAWALPILLFVFWIVRNIPALEPYLAP